MAVWKGLARFLHITSLRIYPAGDHALFASFSQGGDKPHLVLIQMRGSRRTGRTSTLPSSQRARFTVSAGALKRAIRAIWALPFDVTVIF